MSNWSLIDRIALAASVGAAALLVVINWFFVTLVDILTPFLLAPIELAAIGLLFGMSLFWLLSARARGQGRLHRVVLSLACFGVLVAWFVVPVERIQMRMDFRQHQEQRDAVVKRVLATDALDLVKLEPGEKGLSRGGNEVVVDPVGGHRFVLFYYYRGVLDDFSGFLYVPPDADIDDYTSGDGVEAVEKLADGWYIVRGS